MTKIRHKINLRKKTPPAFGLGFDGKSTMVGKVWGFEGGQIGGRRVASNVVPAVRSQR